MQTAREIGHNRARTEALRRVAQALTERGLYDQALETARQVRSMYERAEALAKIAETQARAGFYRSGLRSAQELEVPYERAVVLTGVARGSQVRAAAGSLSRQSPRTTGVRDARR